MQPMQSSNFVRTFEIITVSCVRHKRRSYPIIMSYLPILGNVEAPFKLEMLVLVVVDKG